MKSPNTKMILVQVYSCIRIYIFSKKPKKHIKTTTGLPVGVVLAQIFHFRLNCDRIYEQNVGICHRQAMKISENEWALLDEAGRKKYKDMHAEDKKRHFKELEAYCQKTRSGD
jgi:hypothetical protein